MKKINPRQQALEQIKKTLYIKFLTQPSERKGEVHPAINEEIWGDLEKKKEEDERLKHKPRKNPWNLNPWNDEILT